MWESLKDTFGALDWTALTGWSLAVLLMIVGLAGTVLPIVPGHVIIFVGVLVHKWLVAEPDMSWWGIALLFVILVVTYILEFLSGALGTKWFGGSKWGIWGVILGGIVGIFFGLPGLLLGPLIGGFSFELLFARKKLRAATKSTVGAAVGTTVGMVTKFITAGLMIFVFVADVFWL